MNKFLVKDIISLSLILGFMSGFVASIPVIGLLGLLCVSILAAPLVMVYLIMDGKMELTTPKDSIIYGSLIGFSANITFSIVYCVIVALLELFFRYSSNILLTKMIMNSPVWLLLVCIMFIGVLIAVTNAFTGFATHYIINFIRDIYEKQHPNDKDI